MAGNALVPDALRDSDNRLAPSVTSTGEPDPNTTEGWIQIYRDWKARGADMPPLAEWLQDMPMQGLGFVGGVKPMRVPNPIKPLYHGSPAKFDAFSDKYIGTGEGAQAYSVGHYAAEKEGIGKGYRDKLSMAPLDHLNGELTNFQPYDPNGPAPTVANIKDMLAAHPDPHLNAAAADPAVVRDIATMVQGHDVNSGTWDDAGVKAASRLDTLLGNKSSGHMYELAVHADPEHFLHWDKPLSEQSAVVAKLKDAGIPHGADLKQTGQDLHDTLLHYDTGVDAQGRPDAAELATRLRDAGIPGVKYLDGGSRRAGEGSHNWVVFDPDRIEILRRYGLAGLGLGTAATAATQGNDPTQ